MYEGKIIKFYRERLGMTQEQLGKGICSVTHVSKIELGQTNYSPDIVGFLSKRLNIQMKHELNIFNEIRYKLEKWHKAIIMQQDIEMDRLEVELKVSELIYVSDYRNLYTLLHIRYILAKGKAATAGKIINKLYKLEHKLSSYEWNLFKHVLGIYYIKQEEYQKAIESLKLINGDNYRNTDYNYHLAISYHANDSDYMALSCAEQALQFFKKQNNFLRIIDTETLLLVMQGKDSINSFDERLEKFNALLQTCKLCHSSTRKAKVLHNLAYDYLNIGDSEEAATLYRDSMDLKEKKTSSYLNSLDGYIQSCLNSNLLPKEELLKVIMEGLAIAKEMRALLYTNLFNLSLYKLREQPEVYYNYLSDHAIPFFKMYGHTFSVNYFEKELFLYYKETDQFDKAVEIAHTVISS